MEDQSRTDFITSKELVERISPLLAGHSLKAQGATLAHLMATWLNDHYAVTDDRDRQKELWAKVLTLHAEFVFRLARLDRRQMRTNARSP